MILIGTFFNTMGTYPANTIGFIILSESSSGKFREISVAIILFGVPFSELFYDLVAYLVDNNWRIMSLYFTMIPYIILIISNFYILETPRFYIEKDNSMVVKTMNSIG
jgi:hypothetical protein